MRPFSLRQATSRRNRLNRTAFCLLLGLALIVGLIKLSGPLASIQREHDELARLRRQKAELEVEKARLEAYQSHLATDYGLERAARREGYLRPGERRLVFVRENAEDAPSRGQTQRQSDSP